MKKENQFLFLFCDCDDQIIEKFKNTIEGEEENIACMIENIDIDQLKKIYEISDEELELRNGLKNAVYNSIAIKKI